MMRLLILMLGLGLALALNIDTPKENDPKCSTCCCGNLFGDRFDVYRDRDFRCCNKTIYDPKCATCCNSVLNLNFHEKYSRCCGNVAYDYTTHICCQGNLVKAASNEDQCCGNQAYNQKREICCGGVLHLRGENTRCCGTGAYDRTRGICCKRRITFGCPKIFRCCFNIGYNPEEQFCRNPNTGQLSPSPAQFAGETTSRSCCGSKTRFWIPCEQTCCCGTGVDSATVTQVAVTPTTSCCGTTAYDFTKQLCCFSTVHNVSPKKFQCCHHDSFNPHTHTCCNVNLVKGVGLCCGTNRVFNPKHEICCGGHVFKGKPSRTQCCYNAKTGDWAAYDTKRQLCCEGFVQEGGRGWRCCGHRSYETKWFNCCTNDILAPRDAFRRTGVCRAYSSPP